MKEFIEKLISKLEELTHDNPMVTSNYILRKDAISSVNKLAEEYNNGWIPCSERMPEKTDDYLCQVGNWCMVLPYRKGQNAFLNKEGGPIDVVAWQPLPELYKEVGDKNNI